MCEDATTRRRERVVTVTGSFGVTAATPSCSFSFDLEPPLNLARLSLKGISRDMEPHYKRALLFVLGLAGVRANGGGHI
jgi:hypothetical protein